jgi:pyruvate dehydrogenase E1 component alpha subunit
MLYGQQKIRGFCHLYIGQEACASGAVSALKPGDKWITAYRDHGHPIALGTDPKAVMAELFGKETGTTKGKGGSMHIFDKSVNFIGGHGKGAEALLAKPATTSAEPNPSLNVEVHQNGEPRPETPSTPPSQK